MPRTYTLQTKSEIKKLFCTGWTIGQLAKKFGISKGTLACWAARGKWSAGRVEQKQPLDVLQNGQVVNEDPEVDAVREVVRQNRLATLRNESATAKILSERALQRAEAGLKVESLSDVMSAQEYRSRLWPSTPTDPSMRIDIGAPATDESGSSITLVLKYDHERPRQ